MNIALLGRILRSLRIAREEKQREVAQAIEIEASFLSLIESGQRRMSLANYESLADYYEIPLWVLFAAASKDCPPAAKTILGEWFIDSSRRI